MDYESFLADVQERGRFRSREESVFVTAAVLRAVAEVLPVAHVESLATSVPQELMVYLRGAHEEPDPYFDSNLFLGWVLATVDVTGGRDKTEGGLDLFVAYSTDEAIDRCRYVFSTLKSALDDRQSELISIHLPDSIQQIYADS
ncbi:MAG: DUF2267 domain-containing protein [Chloroflexi bacterium]|nr:DUF2267 domain-containing protein [Chloroflexota bacterium]